MCFARSISSNNTNIEVIEERHLFTTEFYILLIVSIGLVYMDFKNYLLFHSSIGIFNSLIGFGVLLIAINTYKYSYNSFFMILGIAYGFVGMIDIIHTLAYEGMGVFDSSMPLVDIAAQLCVAARGMEAVSLLVATLIVKKSNKKLKPAWIFGIYAVFFAVLIFSIFQWRIFPSCFIDGVGLTKFKVISEYVICIILLIDMWFLVRGKEHVDSQTYDYMLLCLVSTILSEIMFTLYNNDVYGIFAMLGHILQAFSFYFTYKSIVELGLKSPYRLLFNELKETSNSLEKKYSELDNVNNRLKIENEQRLYMEQVLLKNEECYNLLVRSSKEAIGVHIGGKIIFANESLMNLIGITNLREIIGKNVMDLVPKRERNKLSKIMEQRYSGLNPGICFESKLLTTTGEIVEIEAKTTNFSYRGLSAVLVIVKDMSSSKNVEKLRSDFEESRKKLNEVLDANKAITEFFSNVSHELKTPLNVILGAVQVLNLYSNKDMPMYDMQKKYLKIMKQNCYRLLRLVNNVVDMSKIDSGFFKLYLKNYNIVGIVEEITLSVADYIENKGINLIFDTDVEEKVIACDPDKIERIILNLLSNAAKFTKPRDEILVNIVDREDSIVISVKDTGTGIPEDKLQSIFERFKQVDKTIGLNKEGSGIGLSLVKSLVELHGGSININSKEGEGSEFIIELPAKVIEGEDDSISNVMYESKIERIDIEFSDIYSGAV